MRSGPNGPTTTGCWRCPLSHPSPLPPLTAVLRDPGRVAGFGGSIWDRAVAAKADILRRVTELSGARLSRVDIRISGASMSEGGRVH